MTSPPALTPSHSHVDGVGHLHVSHLHQSGEVHLLLDLPVAPHLHRRVSGLQLCLEREWQKMPHDPVTLRRAQQSTKAKEKNNFKIKLPEISGPISDEHQTASGTFSANACAP